MDNSFHYMLLASSTIFTKRVMSELHKSDMTVGLPKVVDYIGKHSGCKQNDIAKGVFVDKATLTGIMTKLEDKGYVLRKRSKEDRREVHVYLTESGKKLLKKIKKTFKENEEIALKGLSEEEIAALSDTLEKICKNLANSEDLQ